MLQLFLRPALSFLAFYTQFPACARSPPTYSYFYHFIVSDDALRESRNHQHCYFYIISSLSSSIAHFCCENVVLLFTTWGHWLRQRYVSVRRPCETMRAWIGHGLLDTLLLVWEHNFHSVSAWNLASSKNKHYIERRGRHGNDLLLSVTSYQGE